MQIGAGGGGCYRIVFVCSSIEMSMTIPGASVDRGRRVRTLHTRTGGDLAIGEADGTCDVEVSK